MTDDRESGGKPDGIAGTISPEDERRAAKSMRKQWKRLAGRLSALAGGGVAIWLGIALWAGLGWGIALAGIGIILLVEQLTRRRFGLRYDLFWVIAGATGLIGGMLIESGADIRFGPAILIALGIFIILSALSGDRAKL
ncbi:hypothetical protein [Saliniramus sp.]|uniref:hypothetical protein n=1 Tax=Saliniramus sp. TaxID=2986772 RepID=UPI002B9F9221|nr:hypothetical protein [Saliniramus sp.]HMB09858.1 hypothetical protein [Saliniramus sp.]